MVVGVEVLIGVLVAASFAFACVALWIGVVGTFGPVQVVHCEQCGRLGLVMPAGRSHECAWCRHDRMLHPVLALHHVGARVHARPHRGVTGRERTIRADRR